MKKFLLLSALFLAVTSIALADEANKIETKENNGIVLESDSTYKFSLSKSCMSFFSLFSTEPVKADSVKTEEKNFLPKPLP